MRSLAAALALTLTACLGAGAPQGDAGSRRPQELVIVARDFSFVGPGRVRPGPTAIVLDNRGNEPHQATMFRLRGKATKQRLLDAFAKDPSTQSALKLVTAVGGPNAALPGKRQRVIVDLAPGTYVVMCFVRSPDGRDHVSKGMVTTFVARGSRRGAPSGKLAGTIGLREMAVDMPEHIQSGEGRWRVVNHGTQVHELALLALAPGRRVEELKSYLGALGSGAPPPGVAPFLEAGGLTALGPGRSADIDLDLAPGMYAALCLVPDPARGGAPHLAEGVVAYFTATG